MKRLLFFSLLPLASLLACTAPSTDADDDASEGEDAYTSASAKLLDFETTIPQAVEDLIKEKSAG